MLTIGRVIKCKAAVAWKHGEELSIEEIEVDLPKAGEVRVKILACSVCRTDDYALSGKDTVTVFPVVLGHEGAGIVESVGEGVTTVKPGDHVLPVCIPQCKTCELCLNPKTNLCEAQITQRQGLMSDGTTRFRCKGQKLFHFMGCSTFSEFTVVSEISVCKILDRFPLDKVCIMSCSAMTGYGAAINTAKVKPGSSCAIFGLGAVGLSVIMGCKAAGAERIICVDLSQDKFERAYKFDVYEFVNPKDYDKPIQEVLIEMTDGGLDYTFDCTGNVNSMRAALEAAHKGWGVSVIVGVEEAGEEISIQSFQLVTGREWKGSYYGGYKSRDSIPKLFDICSNPRGKLHIYNLITHRVQFKDIDKAFRLMHEGKSIRTIVDFQYFSFKYY